MTTCVERTPANRSGAVRFQRAVVRAMITRPIGQWFEFSRGCISDALKDRLTRGGDTSIVCVRHHAAENRQLDRSISDRCEMRPLSKEQVPMPNCGTHEGALKDIVHPQNGGGSWGDVASRGHSKASAGQTSHLVNRRPQQRDAQMLRTKQRSQMAALRMNKSTENGRAASLAVAMGSAFNPKKPYPTPWQIKGTLSGAPHIKDARGISVGTLDDASQQAVDGVRDTDRLDWMIAHSAYISHSRDGEVCNVWFSQDPDDDSNGAVPAEGYPQKCYHDAREAIDAAMRGPNTKE